MIAMKWPIRIRLAAVYCAVFLTVIGLLEVGAYASIRAAIHSIVDHELETRLEGIEDHITRHLPRFGWPQMQGVFDAHPAFQPAYLVIRAADGKTLVQGHGMTGVARPHSRIATVNAGGTAMRVLFVRRYFLGKPYDLLLGTDLQMPAAVLHRLWWIMLVSMLPLVIVCAAAGYWMSGRALAPIQEIMFAARAIDSRRLNQRVPVPATGDEVQQLAETFNAMLERIEEGFYQMREFTANASHELRTPVAIVRAAAEVALLRRKPSEALYRETLERILRESERNSALLESMLELSRIDSRVDGIERDWLSVNNSVSECCERMGALAAARNVALRFVPASADVQVLADKEHARRLWIILIDNAIKYTAPGGSVTVQVRAESGSAFVEVIDTGIGIAPEHQVLIFERFYRTDKARSRSMGGAGLGLAIAQEIATLHEATIHLDSELGKGSRFRIGFPLHLPPQRFADRPADEVLR